MNFRPQRGERLELNLIPMIDVLIVLLIFLVLTTTFARETALTINLPKAVSGNNAPQAPAIELVIDADGHYAVNKKRLERDELDAIKQALQDAGAQENSVLTISADRNARHQGLITALDAASVLGLTHISIAAEAERHEKPAK
ncbi:biopolymer transporter ExbD [Candidatus Methylospira mobilis]|uniref:Biopolymer transporter ExbD n=1 Tax=Candidatus Methylospira mobilis TaxID=1808979 RepID=A0A5Q0BJZ9_9GAMM|nr:biopolymer transporter ExbD [Candidatus Methylospira mobilis]QFY42521.1 biopolymer transporter ExbD [Candidatus Methylospira mobilis]WNV04372.1 biopolymer transporter ExbD [Candidatus Methylospira mobilis]